MFWGAVKGIKLVFFLGLGQEVLGMSLEVLLRRIHGDPVVGSEVLLEVLKGFGSVVVRALEKSVGCSQRPSLRICLRRLRMFVVWKCLWSRRQ